MSLLPFTNYHLRFRNRGYTIVEILASAVVMSITFFVLFYIFQNATTFWARGETSLDNTQQVRLLVNFMEKDLSNVLNYKDGAFSIFVYTNTGDSDMLQFVIRDEGSRSYGASTIVYRLGTTDATAVYRLYDNTNEPDSSWVTTSSPAYEIASGISKLNFSWTDDGTTFSTSNKSWPHDGYILPKAIKISITCMGKGKEKEKTYTNIVFIPAAKD